jgi:diaminopimelate epimerase
MRFHKMQAAGNDFVVIDHRSGIPSGFDLSPGLVAKICDRHFGVGCDQLLWLKPSSEFAASVAILNADGSTAEMCGNGMRAIGMHLARRGSDPGRESYRVRTEAGAESRTVVIDLSGEFPEVALGVPKVLRADEPIDEKFPADPSDLRGQLTENGTFARVDLGNPHAVFFGTEAAVTSVALRMLGPKIETHALFPNRTNVEFAAVLGRRKILARVWERGAGITLACGSGACAIVAAAEAKGLVDPGAKIEVALPGGSVFVRLETGWREGRGQAFLSGPAEDVFSGEWDGDSQDLV